MFKCACVLTAEVLCSPLLLASAACLALKLIQRKPHNIWRSHQCTHTHHIPDQCYGTYAKSINPRRCLYPFLLQEKLCLCGCVRAVAAAAVVATMRVSELLLRSYVWEQPGVCVSGTEGPNDGADQSLNLHPTKEVTSQ